MKLAGAIAIVIGIALLGLAVYGVVDYQKADDSTRMESAMYNMFGTGLTSNERPAEPFSFKLYRARVLLFVAGGALTLAGLSLMVMRTPSPARSAVGHFARGAVRPAGAAGSRSPYRSAASGSVSPAAAGVPPAPRPAKPDDFPCPHCGERLPLDAMFCRHCGRSVKKAEAPACPSCGAKPESGWEFCISCGARLDAAPAKAPSREAPEPCGLDGHRGAAPARAPSREAPARPAGGAEPREAVPRRAMPGPASAPAKNPHMKSTGGL